jgi:hypothetical protein
VAITSPSEPEANTYHSASTSRLNQARIAPTSLRALRHDDNMSANSSNATAIVESLDPKDIEARLAELDREGRALRLLLRAARARQGRPSKRETDCKAAYVSQKSAGALRSARPKGIGYDQR